VKKALAFILAIMVLSFSMIPCADAAGLLGQDHVKVEYASQDKHDDAGIDGCTPFCICTCCAGFSVNCLSTFISKLNLPHRTPYSSFIQENPKNIALPIWQPPQLL
jgi:hypothetical protein